MSFKKPLVYWTCDVSLVRDTEKSVLFKFINLKEKSEFIPKSCVKSYHNTPGVDQVVEIAEWILQKKGLIKDTKEELKMNEGYVKQMVPLLQRSDPLKEEGGKIKVGWTRKENCHYCGKYAELIGGLCPDCAKEEEMRLSMESMGYREEGCRLCGRRAVLTGGLCNNCAIKEEQSVEFRSEKEVLGIEETRQAVKWIKDNLLNITMVFTKEGIVVQIAEKDINKTWEFIGKDNCSWCSEYDWVEKTNKICLVCWMARVLEYEYGDVEAVKHRDIVLGIVKREVPHFDFFEIDE